MKNYILHFNGRTLGSIDAFRSFRFEGDFESDKAFVIELYHQYEFIKPKEFYIDGEKADFWLTCKNSFAEKPENKQVLEYLLRDKKNRAACFDIHGNPFQISVFQADAGFLVATAYDAAGKPIFGMKGIILPRYTILSWLEDSKARIYTEVK